MYPQQYQQQQPPESNPRPIAQPPSGGVDRKGFFGSLFDLSFSSFVTTKIIKLLYALQIIGAVVLLVVGLAAGALKISDDSAIAGVGMMVAAPFGAILMLVLGRVYLELTIVLFRIAEDIGDINTKTR
jgi:hypothetical protein